MAQREKVKVEEELKKKLQKERWLGKRRRCVTDGRTWGKRSRLEEQ